MRHPFASFFSTSPTRKMGIEFDATTGLDPVLTGGTTVTWTSTAGTVATGTTPSPALDEATLWTIEMDDYSAVTAIDANTDNVTKFIPVIDNTGLATITLNDNPNLDVDALVSVIHALRRQLPAMTVNVGGTCPTATGTSDTLILDLIENYSHTWTWNGNGFLFTVKTDNGGTSNNDQFTIPLFSGETYNFTVFYDGTSTTHTTDSDLTLTFPSGAGTYGVSIYGTFPRIYFNNSGDKAKLTGITQFGDTSWGTDWTSAFYGCSNLTDNLTLPTNLTITENAFRGTGLTGSVQALPVGVTNCAGMYQDAALDGTISDHSASDGTLTNVSNYLNGNSGLTGNSEDFWNWTTPPTTTSGCYTGCTSLTDYYSIPPTYGGGGVTQPDNGYSVSRAIYSGYSGYLIEVERSSDNTTLDVGTDANGDLDTAAIATFCSGTDGKVRTLYDQFGSKNAVETDHATQAKIYDSVTGIETDNGKPAFYNSAATAEYVFTSEISAKTLVAVVNQDSNVVSQVFGPSSVLVRTKVSPADWRVDGDANDFFVYSTDTGSWYSNGAAKTADYTDASQQIIYVTNASPARTVTTILSSYASRSLRGFGQEFMLYAADESSNAVSNSNSINAYYGAY